SFYIPYRPLPAFPPRRSSDLVQRAEHPRRRQAAKPFHGSDEPHFLAVDFGPLGRVIEVKPPHIRFIDDDGIAFGESRAKFRGQRSEEHTSELQSHLNLVCRLL